MKTKVIYTIMILLIICCKPTFSQEMRSSQEIADMLGNCEVVPFIIKNKEIGDIISRVLPAVKYDFIYTNYTIPRGRGFRLTYMDKGYNLEDFNRLLIDIKYLGDSTIRFTDEDIIKTYIYIEACSHTTIVNDSITIAFDILKIDKSYSGQISIQDKDRGFSDTRLNYSAKATWSTHTSEPDSNALYYEFNIVNSEIVSINKLEYFQGVFDYRTKRNMGFYAFPNSEVLEPRAREYLIEYLKKQKKK